MSTWPIALVPRRRRRRCTPGPGLPAAALLPALLPALLLAACSDGGVDPTPPAPAPAVVSIAFSLGSQAGVAELEEAYAQATRVRLRLTRPSAGELNREVAKPAGADARVPVTVEMTRSQESAQLTVELTHESGALFRGSHEVVLKAGETTEAPLALAPIPARVQVQKPLPPLESVGDSLQLAGAVVFATGTAIPGLSLAWQALDAGVVEVGADGRLVSRAEGEARVEARYQTMADTVLVQVAAVVASVTVTADATMLAVGQTLQLGAVLRDARGNPLELAAPGGGAGGRTLTWSSSRPAIAQVDAHSGLVSALAPDTVTITATAGQGPSGSLGLTILPTAPAVHLLVDDFAGTAVDLGKWSYYGEPSRTGQDDRLIVTLTANVAGYGGLIYRLPHDFTGSTFLAEISQVAAGGPLTETFVGVASPDEEEYVVITSLGGRISAWRKWRGEAYARVGSELTLNPTNHRFRRIREQGGTVFFEVSANGTSWTRPSGWSIAHQFTEPGSLHGIVGAGAFAADPGAGTAVFENVNTTVPAIPSTLSATAAATQVELAWDDRSVNEQGFRIERRTGEGAFAEIATVGAGVRQYHDRDVQPGATYVYRVRAYNARGASGYTNQAAVTLPAGGS